jgi:hypothetical protein
MQKEIKDAMSAFKLKIQKTVQKMRTYFGYGYLIAYIWIGFAIFAIIENDAMVILWAMIPVGLSLWLYPKMAKSRKSLANLKNAEILPDLEALLKSSKQLGQTSKDYLYRVKTVMLTLDFEKDIQTKTEGQITIICMFSYIFGLFIFIRNFPTENEILKWIGMFLTTFGLVVVMGLFLLYFKFIKRASEFFVRHHISGFVKKSRRNNKNVIDMIDACRDSSLQSDKEMTKKVSEELQQLDEDLEKIQESLRGHKRSITISLASILGYVASLITFLYNIYPQFQNGSLQMLSLSTAS